MNPKHLKAKLFFNIKMNEKKSYFTEKKKGFLRY